MNSNTTQYDKQVSTVKKYDTAKKSNISTSIFNDDINTYDFNEKPKWREFKGRKLVLRMPVTKINKKLSNMTQEFIERVVPGGASYLKHQDTIEEMNSPINQVSNTEFSPQPNVFTPYSPVQSPTMMVR